MIDLESHSHTQGRYQADKRAAAIISIVAVVSLGLAKLVIGLLTGSLGLIADSIHSGVDFVSALLTLLAVHWADRPPDGDHPYGHGRAENLAAFVEVLLLIGSALWLAYEAIRRILLGESGVNPAPLAFLVLLLSIGVSLWRSRAMTRIANHHGSAALAAAALDFRMDVWSSGVVLAGLAIELVGRRIGLPSVFVVADALAGLIVAGLVIVTAGRLARETIDALVDRSPLDIAARMSEAVAMVTGVLEVRRVRLRQVGGGYFADVVAIAPRTITLPESHELAEKIERAVLGVEPRTDVVIHLEPGVGEAETIVDKVHLTARELGVRVHDVQVRQVHGRLDVNLHVEVRPSLSLENAHKLASELERRIAAASSRIRQVNTHLEIESPELARRVDVTHHEGALVRQIKAVSTEIIGPEGCHDVRIYRPVGRGRERDVVLHCVFSPAIPVGEAHQQAEHLERALRARLPSLGSVLVHVEPASGANGVT